MTELSNIKQTMSSREIAALTGKEHYNVLRDIDNLNEHYEKLHLLKIEEMFSTRELPNGGQQKDRYFLLTKIQTFDLMTGYRPDLRIRVNRRWEELERKNADPDMIVLQAMNILQDKLKLREAQIVEQNRQIRESSPKVVFADAVSKSSDLILVRDYAKVLSDQGFSTGQNRLFAWFRDNGYLTRYNKPYQRWVDMGLFKVIERASVGSDSSVTFTTTMITGKGQVYFAEKIRKQQGVLPFKDTKASLRVS